MQPVYLSPPLIIHYTVCVFIYSMLFIHIYPLISNMFLVSQYSLVHSQSAQLPQCFLEKNQFASLMLVKLEYIGKINYVFTSYKKSKRRTDFKLSIRKYGCHVGVCVVFWYPISQFKHCHIIL